MTIQHARHEMPICVYLCYTPGCNSKVERWMPTADEGLALRLECPRCGVAMQCAWTGGQTPTPNLKDARVPGHRS